MKKYQTEEERKEARRESKRKWREKNTGYMKQYYQDNRAKIVEQHKQYYQDNKEKIAEYNQDNKEKRSEYNKMWREKNAEHNKQYSKQWREMNPEYHKEYSKQYNKTPMGRARHLATAYNQADTKYNRGECSLTALWIRNYIFTSKCIYCGESDWTKLGCDRIDNSKPHTEDNVIPCCEACNIKRNRKSFEEFLTLMTK